MAPLQQLNLKVPEPVATHWRAQAAAQGLSVRDWLVSITAPTAAPQARAGAAGLADRVAQLEAQAAELAQAVAQLQAQGPPPRSPRLLRAGAAPGSPDKPSPEPGRPAAALLSDLPPGALPTAALADLLGIKRGSLNERLRRAGGAREGMQLEGWRCIGQRRPERGGPPQSVWVPAEG